MAARTPPRVPWWPLLVALDIVILDQVSKYFVVRYLGPAGTIHSIPLIGDWLRLVYLENTGVSFGRLQNFSPYITILTTAIVIGLLVAYRRLIVPSRWANAALGLILGGAVGNLIDRISTALRLGLDKAYVVDFIDLRFWAVFNVADSAITIGGILYGAYLLLFQREKPSGEPEEKPCPRPGDPPLGE